MNEELPSAREELETGREDLRSINEELTTVNAELKSKVDELAHTNSDLQNLMASTSIATIFVDREQRIVRYTPPAVTLFHLIPGDIGRPLADLQHRLDYPDLAEDAGRVLEQLVPIEREISAAAGRWFLVRLLPYRSADDRISGIVLTFVEITASKRGEALLRESSTGLRRAMAVGRIFSWELDPATRQLEWSDNMESVLGFALPGDIDRTYEMIHPEDRADVAAAVENALATGGDYEAEFRLLHPGTRQIIYLRSQGAVSAATAHASARFVGISQDITERQRADTALRESEGRFRALVTASSDALYEMNADWTEMRPLHAGGFIAALTAPTKEWLERYVLPEDHRAVLSAVREAVESETVFALEHRVRRADGSIGWTFSRAIPVRNERGEIENWFGVASDITERRQAEAARQLSEERLRLIIENARDYAIVALDLARRITTWNSGAERILGYPEAEIIGRSADLIFTAEDVAAAVPDREVEAALRDGRAADERWHLRKDGTRFWGSGVMMAMRDASGTAVGLVKIFRDQTVAREAQETLERSQRDLWEALQEMEKAQAVAETARRTKDQFLAVLSHELRTPLTPVLMAVRTLRRQQNLPPLISEALDMITRNVQLEAHLIDDLLDITRVERGKFELEFAEVDLHQIVRHSVEVATPDFENKSQKFEAVLDAPEHRLHGDVTRLQQVFWNLLKNAAKFTPDGGTIRLRTWNADDKILVQVTDTGVGFLPEALDRIFDPFAQANLAVTRRFGGLGLGLAIAKATVDGHGGRIVAESPGEDRGATFIVELPLTRPHPPQA